MEEIKAQYWDNEKKYPYEYKPEVFIETITDYYRDYTYGQTIRKLKPGIEVESSISSTKKYCFATKSASQSIPNVSGTTITLNTYETNDSAMSVTADRITITQAWQYLINAQVSYASNATWIREAFIRVNGGTIFLDTYATTNPSDITNVVMSTIKTFSLNDYIDIRAFQSSWAGLNVNAGISYTFLSVHQL